MRQRNLYVVECWSNELGPDLSGTEEIHQVDTIHFATNLKAARRWARHHMNWGGVEGVHPSWVPWHFRIRKVKMNEDGCHVVHNTNEVMDIIHP